MNPLDYIIITILAALLIKGLINGFIKELFSFLAFIIGALVAYFFAVDVSSVLCELLPQSCKLGSLVFLLLFLITALAVSYLGRLLTKAAKYMALGGINRLFGGIFGLLKGIIILFILLVLFNAIAEIVDIPTTSTLDNSLILSAFRDFVDIDSRLIQDALYTG